VNSNVNHSELKYNIERGEKVGSQTHAQLSSMSQIVSKRRFLYLCLKHVGGHCIIKLDLNTNVICRFLMLYISLTHIIWNA
jgi:hypothetical protein